MKEVKGKEQFFAIDPRIIKAVSNGLVKTEILFPDVEEIPEGQEFRLKVTKDNFSLWQDAVHSYSKRLGIAKDMSDAELQKEIDNSGVTPIPPEKFKNFVKGQIKAKNSLAEVQRNLSSGKITRPENWETFGKIEVSLPFGVIKNVVIAMESGVQEAVEKEIGYEHILMTTNKKRHHLRQRALYPANMMEIAMQLKEQGVELNKEEIQMLRGDNYIHGFNLRRFESLLRDASKKG